MRRRLSTYPKIVACAGPVYFGDQGIERCETCGGCICCDFDNVDHSKAEYRCFVGRDGVCHLKAHAGRPCTTTPRAGGV